MQTVTHDHEPVYRVVRAGWSDPLDTSYSRKQRENRWNPPDVFGVLYTNCSEHVARINALTTFRFAGVVLDDLQASVRPRLVEIAWAGEVVDVVSTQGIEAAGFVPAYPEGVGYRETQPRAAAWHGEGSEGVVCRSAALARMGYDSWGGSHISWSELAIFVENARRKPTLVRRRPDLTWLFPEPAPSSQC